jgi:hypothetical protein
MVLPYDTVQQWINLRVSPLGVVPQRDRRPRLIVDYSFSGVNADTVPPVAPRESMQFGRALQQILKTVVHADPSISTQDRYRRWLLSSLAPDEGYPEARGRLLAHHARPIPTGRLPIGAANDG